MTTSSRKTPPSQKWPAWTEARYFQFVRSALRQCWIRWPPRAEALKLARRNVTGKGRQKYEYRCAACKEWFMGKEVQVDHIIPAGSCRTHDEIGPFVDRLLVGVHGLRVLCIPCHKQVTDEQRGG